MTFKLIFVILMALGALGVAESNEYLPQALNRLLFDGPASISNARTTPSRNNLPTLKQMIYYNYYAASTYYGYAHADLSCECCRKYRPDVFKHVVLNNDDQNTLALVTLSKTRKEIVVAFRGTWNIFNIVQDAIFISARNSNTPSPIKVHQGFYLATMSLYEAVVRQLSSYLTDAPESKVVITGHSLGGAIARLTYFFLADTKQFPLVKYELYTYGEPRVGNKPFADFMNSQPITSARVVARADIVPHVPPTSIARTPLAGDYYVHPQTEYWINGKTGQRFCRRTFYEDPKCSMRMGPFYSILDHTVYFDTNLGTVLGQPLIFAYLPLGALDPVDDLPPVPTPIENLFGGITSGLLDVLTP